MSRENLVSIAVEEIKSSKINDVDFSNLSFGSVFTDHMMICEFKNGAWNAPKITPYQPLTLDPSARVFHYGQAVFEGMKAYKDDNDDVWLFRPEDNWKRINDSAKRLEMPAFPKKYFMESLTTLLKLDKEWIKKGDGNSLYIRPFVIASESGVSASPSNEYKFMIICSPVQAYYGGEVRVKIAEKFSRAASGGFGYAKAAGNYAGQFYPTRLAQEEGFQQIIWTDSETHEYLEEAGTMNLFFRINDKLVTCPISDRILDGITRKSVITMAEDMGIEVDIRPIKVSELLAAQENGSLKEIFGSGTAAVISPVLGFGYKGKKYELSPITNTYAATIKEKLTNLQCNKSEDKFGWRFKV